MSIVIIGGNECMICEYKNICKRFGCKAKIFAKKHGMLRKELGNPDLFVLFTNTASHKMVIICISGSKKEKYSHCPYPYQQFLSLTNPFDQALLSIKLANFISIGDKFKLIPQYLCRPFTHEHSLKKNFKIIHNRTDGII